MGCSNLTAQVSDNVIVMTSSREEVELRVVVCRAKTCGQKQNSEIHQSLSLWITALIAAQDNNSMIYGEFPPQLLRICFILR